MKSGPAKSTGTSAASSGAEGTDLGAEGTDLGVAAAAANAAVWEAATAVAGVGLAAAAVVRVAAAAVAGERSEILLKHDIVPFARLDNGIGIYRFQYNGNATPHLSASWRKKSRKSCQAQSRAGTTDICASTTTRSASSS